MSKVLFFSNIFEENSFKLLQLLKLYIFFSHSSQYTELIILGLHKSLNFSISFLSSTTHINNLSLKHYYSLVKLVCFFMRIISFRDLNILLNCNNLNFRANIFIVQLLKSLATHFYYFFKVKANFFF